MGRIINEFQNLIESQPHTHPVVEIIWNNSCQSHELYKQAAQKVEDLIIIFDK